MKLSCQGKSSCRWPVNRHILPAVAAISGKLSSRHHLCDKRTAGSLAIILSENIAPEAKIGVE